MKTISKVITVMLTATVPAIAAGAVQEVSSPDGLTVVTVSDEGGTPTYTVKHDNVDFVKQSPLGLVTNIGDFSRNMKLTSAKPVERVRDSYSLRNIKKNHVDYEANRGVFTFACDGRDAVDVIFEVSDNNVAFRYMVHL
ncbi:MAG: glycoside hydrolase family 97 N-terminal domain-containing protein [Duncaniella sp.]|nr:glycoside hydrolase family 97 N-terminal domain-containing protein [Duncaniella sp.]